MGKEILKKVDDKIEYTNAYNHLLNTIEAFSRFITNVPKTMDYIIKEMYWRYDKAAYSISEAGDREKSPEERIKSLHEAHMVLLRQQNSFEIIHKSHGCTIGQANEVIELTKNVYEQCKKWKNWLVKQIN